MGSGCGSVFEVRPVLDLRYFALECMVSGYTIQLMTICNEMGKSAKELNRTFLLIAALSSIFWFFLTALLI